MNYLDELNEAQRAAVEYMDGPSLVIAGAGSGKTRVLTYKIAYLLEHGAKASEILALTFTNKAAREMKSRVEHIVGPDTAKYLMMGTFHSIAARILRREADQIGFTSDFSIYDTADMHSLLRLVLKERGLDEKSYKPAVVLGIISDCKSKLITPLQYAQDNDFAKRDKMAKMPFMPDVYSDYQKRLRSANAMDFDDLLTNLYYFLRDHHEKRREYQQRFQYVLVDEYQDTNYVQFLLVKMLAEPQNKICVVGDDAQSIYSFRGADIRNILGFQRQYEDAKLFKLERNYRSTRTIVGAANSLIHHNGDQIYKEIYSEKEQGEPILLTSYPTDRDEAEGVVREVRRLNRPLPGQKSYSLNQMAVLYRTNSQSRTFENELRKYGVPYRIYGGTSFYQRKEVKDAIAYFRLVINNRDWEAMARCISVPARGIGDVTIRKIREEGFDAIAHRNKPVLHFVEMIRGFEEMAYTVDAYTFAERVLRESGLLMAMDADKSPEGVDRKQNVDELLAGIHEFVELRREVGEEAHISDFLSEVSLLTDQDEKQKDDTARLTLMTVHAAKGLEFPIVFVVGMEADLFPSSYSKGPRELEEERRLFYVAITRAMERCFLSYAGQRFRNGNVNLTNPSPFLQDIDAQFIHREMANHTSGFGPMSTFAPHPMAPKTPTAGMSKLHSGAGETVHALKGTGFRNGDRVRHKVFGEGNVIRVYEQSDNEKIDILFDSVGQKTLLLTYAKLEKI